MSAVVSHQNVRLESGAHRSPSDGACVMELASMLAGEPFTDRPATACPVIAGFLRAYNDRVTDDRRQDLLPCASLVVGSAAASAQTARLALLVATALEAHDAQGRWLRAVTVHQRRRLRALARVPMRASSLDEIGTIAAGIFSHAANGHARALALVSELVSVAGQTRVGPRRAPVLVRR